ncbi:zinc ribbon domain-containing protein [Collinsella ihumii]|uniref:Zinc ribbon domain-containing protein n=1 Tax=Collinsella ihumii TaxID=1720204 RepID=A0ABT7XBV7_9ACTN|nr:zinc ribbon domain-containing protein [Collinsella ihumii]
MAKSYDLGKKSDMRRFTRDLEREVKGIAREKIKRGGLEIECPACGSPMHASSGLNTCPACGKTTEVTFDWTNF